MTEDTSCVHPDCVYRRRNGDLQNLGYPGRCMYALMTGHSRIAGLSPEEQLPCNCPRYVSDGTTPAPTAGPGWKEQAEKLYREGKTDREIAEAVGVGHSTVQSWRSKRLKMPPNPDKRGTKPIFDWKRAEELYRKGMNDIEIGKALGCSTTAVWRWRYKHELFPNGRRGRRAEE